MADSIIRLRVDSAEYDNKLKRAGEGAYALHRRLPQGGRHAGRGGARDAVVRSEPRQDVHREPLGSRQPLGDDQDLYRSLHAVP